jgi:hypothetical protein
MRILRDTPISLTPEYVLEEQYRRRHKPLHPGMLEVTTEAVKLGEALVAPAVVYDEFPVRKVVGDQVYLEVDGRDQETVGRLTVGPKADLLAPAERVVAAVLTIGPALERRVRELHSAGKSLLAYMLDSVGVLALGATGEALRAMAEERAAQMGWGVSAALSPGSLLGWRVTGQRELCALLSLEEIGVKLNSHSVLEPQKSASVVIGLGPGYESAHVGSMCRYCSLADTCWRRRGDVA